jgi:hypothetical protein
MDHLQLVRGAFSPKFFYALLSFKDTLMFRQSVAVLCLLLASISCPAQTNSNSLISNPTLKIDEASSSAPKGWQLDGTAVEFASDSTIKHKGPQSLRIKFAKGAPYAGIVQRLEAEPVRGKTVFIDGWLARDNGDAPVGVWVRAFDKDRKSIAYANSYELPNAADRSFRRHLIELKVPEETVVILVGASIYGETGTAWLGSLDAYVKD